MAIGFIGLGNLGSAIAKRLSDMGEEVIVWNRSVDKAKKLGFPIALSPKELSEKCDTVFMCLFDSAGVRNVMCMDKGLLSSSLKGKTIIDLTTNHFNDVLEFHAMVEAKDGNYLESPVFGSVVPASKGEVTIVTAGKEEVFLTCKPLLEKFGQSIFHLKEPGMASKMKLINNLCLGSFMATIAECTSLGVACGIDKTQLLDILGVGGGKSLVLAAKTQKLINEDYSPHFSNAAINKDLHCLQDLAYSMNRPLYTASVVKELYSKMRMMGKGEEDICSIYQLFKA
ncbi:MAG: NAD(P)-dependent oxidoreductase [Sulfurospirillaceae bacterium]|nr:NAD(P)-dependent oxidoreductase [Sulfurospirillaceae bacterium]MDD2826976.1 NAD(P)-dependent oxidoreductase [Sulfurospirillaceae bacterium]